MGKKNEEKLRLEQLVLLHSTPQLLDSAQLLSLKTGKLPVSI
jgi:hypothetical protein